MKSPLIFNYKKFSFVTSGFHLIIFVNDVEWNLLLEIAKLADDTILCADDYTNIQADSNRLIEQREEWQMSFNVHKYKVIHTDDKNLNFKYLIRDSELGIVIQVKCLEVIIQQ